MSPRTIHAACSRCGHPRFKSSPLLPTSPQLVEIRTFLRSNTLPADPSGLRDVVDNAQKELARYDSEIAEAQAILDRLIFERDALASYADGCRSLFAPVRRMPHELLVEIFEACGPLWTDGQLSNDSTAKMEVDRLSQRHLMRVSQVSLRWNGIAMGTPKLWATLIIDTRLWNATGIPAGTLLSALATSLTRSANFPLVIQAGVWSGDPEASNILRMLCTHASRWRDVYLWLDTEATPLVLGVKGDLPLLETLKLGGIFPAKIDFFKDAPRLMDFHLTGLPQNMPTIPWHQLQMFRYDVSSYRSALDSLKYTQSLPAQCHFDLDVELSKSSASWDDVPLAPISANIGRLTLVFRLSEGTPQSSLSGIFKAVTLRDLEELTIMSQSGPPVIWDPVNFSSLATRSVFSTHLVRLTIVAIITEEELLQCLGSLLHLQELTLTDFFTRQKHILITDSLLRALSWPGKMLTPRLSRLSLTSVLAFTDDAYFHLATSRAKSVAQHPDLGCKFTAELLWLPARSRELSTELVVNIGQLITRGEMDFVFEKF